MPQIEQLSLSRLWLCENFILQVSQRELKMRFQVLIESLSSIKKYSLDFLMRQSSLAFLDRGFVRILLSRCLRGKWKIALIGRELLEHNSI